MRRPTGYLLTALLTLYLTAGLCATDVAGQQASAPRTQPIAHIVYNGDMAPLLAKLAQELDVNIGLEIYPPRQRIPVKIELKNPTSHDLLNAIVNSTSGYVWRETDAGVEVSPVRGGSALLETSIDSFRVSNVDQGEAFDLLMNLPEVQAGMGGLNLQYRSTRAATAKRRGERRGVKFSMSLEGVSLRQALHKIAERGGRFWAFRRHDNGPDGEFITIDAGDW